MLRKSKVILIISLIFTSVISFSTNVFASELNQESDRIFLLEGKNSVTHWRELHQRQYNFSPYEPTGIYVQPNESITVEVSGAESIKAYIGTYGYDKDIKIEQLKMGNNTISSVDGGLLYFQNENSTGVATVKVVNGGSLIPFFDLNKHKNEDYNAMMKKYPNTYAVELKSERALVTVTYEEAEKHLKNPEELLRKMDQMIEVQDQVSGVGRYYDGEAAQDPHYVHFVEARHSNGYMFATHHYTGYTKNGVKFILDVDLFTKDGWGPWHEGGHQRQQPSWLWDGLKEVTVNIYSMATQRAFGNPSRLEGGIYNKMMEYLNLPQDQKNYDEINDLFLKLAMFWQLDLAFGDQFYPTLHQRYRTLTVDSVPFTNEEKQQLFIRTASMVADRNLIPFFEQWGLPITQETKDIISTYPTLQKNIWLGQDSKPIVEALVPQYNPIGTPHLSIHNNQINLEIEKKDQEVNNR